MTVEITSVTINKRIVTIEAIDVSEENLQWIERIRDDCFDREIAFNFDLNQKSANIYLYRFLHHQKKVIELQPDLLIDALFAIVGTVTNISDKYLDYDSVA